MASSAPVVYLPHQATYPLKILGYALYGTMVYFLWKWFVAEPFGLATLPLPNAFGLSTLIRAATDHYYSRTIQEWNKLAVHTVIAPLGALAFGFVCHLWAIYEAGQ